MFSSTKQTGEPCEAFASRNDRFLFVNDITLRYGGQNLFHWIKDDRQKIAQQLVNLGIPGIEAGFPALGSEERGQVEKVVQEVGSQTIAMPDGSSAHPRISTIARLLEQQDIHESLSAIRHAPNRGINLFHAHSIRTGHPMASYFTRMGVPPQKMMEMEAKAHVLDTCILRDSVSLIRAEDPDCAIQFSIEDGLAMESWMLDNTVVAAAESGVDIINVVDPVGDAIPRNVFATYQRLYKLIHEQTERNVKLSWQGNNDAQMGAACSLEALYGGADQVEPSIMGLGERGGATPLEAFLAALDMNKLQHAKYAGVRSITDSIVRSEVVNTSKLVYGLLDQNIPPHFPIVGESVFSVTLREGPRPMGYGMQ